MEKLLDGLQRKHRLGEYGLREHEFRLTLLLIARRTDAGRPIEKLYHRLRSTYAGRHERKSQPGNDRDAIKRSWIIRQPGCPSGLDSLAESKRPMARNERIVRLDACAGRPSQAHRVPVVYHLIFVLGHEEHQVLGFSTDLERSDRADRRPLRPRQPA